MKFQGGLTWKKMPLDVKIVVVLGVIASIMHFLVFTLILLGLAHSPSGYQHRVLFGLLRFVSDLAVGTHSFIMATVCLGCAYGLAKGYKFAWWLMLIFSGSNIVDSFLLSSDFPITGTTSIFFSLMMIGWLIFRRKLYHIGEAREKEATES